MPDSSLAVLAKAIETVSTHILDYALVLAAVGTITMALIELVKAVLHARLFFHRVMITRWIGDDGAVRDELLQLAVAGAKNAAALYDQASEKMMGQIQAAANVALDFPAVYPRLYGFLTAGSAQAGMDTDQEKWRRFAARMTQGIPAEATARAQFEADSRESTQARARLGNLVTRRLDALQTRLEYRWARLNQLTGLVAGTVLLWATLPATGDGKPIGWETRLTIAVFGGLVAPFAKDVVTALTGLRTRR